ncbi:MAG: hypothetical protein AW09_001620 [Candidatus Accumulibacter phosphatis]|uniref:Uncharacterized protein n=1 Tax=Candidatus Accumulibacter phosphatis TaxID=327160 RepID=A0A080LWW4_9PROT|nr:MAG: hypothetical protein AW09_001620 [Candidatus Accumulibacter phosphatis]
MPAGQGADGTGSLQTVHVRHLHIHQDQIVVGALYHRQRLLTIGRRVYRQVDGTQQFLCHLAVDGIVFHQQDAFPRATLA